jgi:hypothetical protein
VDAFALPPSIILSGIAADFSWPSQESCREWQYSTNEAVNFVLAGGFLPDIRVAIQSRFEISEWVVIACRRTIHWRHRS